MLIQTYLLMNRHTQTQMIHAQRTHSLRLSFLPDWFAVSVRVLKAHLFQFAASVELVVARVRLLPQVLHVHTDQHLPQLHKITMVLVLH